MPFYPKKRKCRQKDKKKTKGSYVVVKKKSDGSEEQVSCHTSEKKAKGSIGAKYMNAGDDSNVLKDFISEAIKSYAGSHPEESYGGGSSKEKDFMFDKPGLTTWDEDREWVKQYFKSMGLIR